MVHRPGVANLDAGGLNWNPCTNQEDDTGVRWHGEVDEEMVPSWHASTFLCLLGVDFIMEGHMTSYSYKVPTSNLVPFGGFLHCFNLFELFQRDIIQTLQQNHVGVG